MPPATRGAPGLGKKRVALLVKTFTILSGSPGATAAAQIWRPDEAGDLQPVTEFVIVSNEGFTQELPGGSKLIVVQLPGKPSSQWFALYPSKGGIDAALFRRYTLLPPPGS